MSAVVWIVTVLLAAIFLFSGAAAVGWVLAVRHSARARRHPQLAPASDGAPPATPS